jgi:hypothetical protein
MGMDKNWLAEAIEKVRCGNVTNDYVFTLAGQIGFYQKEIKSLRKENADLREGLRKLEWIWVEGSCKQCPACRVTVPGEVIYPKHRPDCWIAKLIGDGE